MAFINETNVLAFAPELDELDDEAFADILAYANAMTGDAFGEPETGPTLRLARIFLAAHLGTISLDGASGAAGPVTSEGAGGLTISYANTSKSTDEGLALTIYGRQYLSLIQNSLARAWVLL